MLKHTVICASLCLVSLFVGIAISPSVTEAYYEGVMRSSNSPARRLKAAFALGKTDSGVARLWNIVEDGSRGSAEAIAELYNSRRPLQVHWLLGLMDSLAQQKRYREYRALLKALDYSEMHRFVIASLQYDLAHQSDQTIKTQIREILQ